MITLNIKELAQKAHKAAVAKGFYENPKSNTEIIWLIITEFAEATNAHRKNGYADLDSFYNELHLCGSFKQAYEYSVKDTFQAEIAGAFIRLLDFLGFSDVFYLDEYEFSTFEYENLSHLFMQNAKTFHYLLENRIDVKEAVFKAIESLFSIAQKEGFDLMQFIELEMKYNETRPHKNGAKY